jgi:hypothetical protein
MSRNGIGNTARKLYAKLVGNLAGPFGAFLPAEWIEAILADLSYRFRSTAFSPLGDGLGIHRPGSRSGPFL